MPKKIVSNFAIEIKDLHKTFRLPNEQHSGIKQIILAFFKRNRKKGYESQHVLKGVSFKVKKGDFFGIVGRNGSGKSTLLKLLSGIYTPDSGAVEVNGTLVPFIELGVGFNPELSGRENVFLNGALLGFSRDEMEVMYDEIVEFAELERFMDQKLKNYSSGMQVRLAFSIAIRAKSDILVLDEVLAVGDEAFQRKCNEYFASLKGEGKTVILVTHAMDSVRQFCNRAILIEGGEIKIDGTPEDVASQYSIDNYGPRDGSREKSRHNIGLSDTVPDIRVVPVSKQVLKSSDDFEFDVVYRVTEDIPVRIGISLVDERAGGSSVFDDQVKEGGKLIETSTLSGEYTFRYSIPLSRFNDREFLVKASLHRVVGGASEMIAYTAEERVCRFMIRNGDTKDNGLLREKGKWMQR